MFQSCHNFLSTLTATQGLHDHTHLQRRQNLWLNWKLLVQLLVQLLGLLAPWQQASHSLSAQHA